MTETWASPAEKTEAFTEELRRLLNRFGVEKASGTPDFILADYLVDTLRAYNTTVHARADWRGEGVDLPTTPEDA